MLEEFHSGQALSWIKFNSNVLTLSVAGLSTAPLVDGPTTERLLSYPDDEVDSAISYRCPAAPEDSWLFPITV